MILLGIPEKIKLSSLAPFIFITTYNLWFMNERIHDI